MKLLPEPSVGLASSTSFSVMPVPTTLALVIDDSEDCCQIADYVLTQLGCQCLTAATATDGLSLAIAFAPDIILLDAVLPDFSGIDLLHALNQQHPSTNSVVIAVTALASTTDREQLLQAGCVSYLSKPYLLQDLLDILSPYLQDCLHTNSKKLACPS